MPLPPGFTLDPAPVAAQSPSAIVDMLVNRAYDPALMRRWKPQEQETYLQQVRAKDPTFDMAAYPSQAAAKKTFTSGQYSQTKTSVNQLIGHINTLNDAYGKLKNGDYQWWNAIGNATERYSGDRDFQKAYGNFDTAANIVASEAAKTFKGSGAPAEREIQEWRAQLSPNMPPAEFQGRVDALMQLLGSRLGSLDDTYKQAVGRPRDFTILSPASRAILQHRLKKNPDDLEGLAGIAGAAAAAAPPPPNVQRSTPAPQQQPPASAGQIIRTPDGKHWRKRPDGHMEEVP